MSVGDSKLLVAGQSTGGTSPAYVERGDGNAVVVEAWPDGTGTATVQMLESADAITGFFATSDAQGLMTGITARTKRQVSNVLPYLKVQITITSGRWNVRVTPIEATGVTSITASVSGAVDQGAPGAGGVNAWPVQEADGASVALGATTDAAVLTNAAGTMLGKLRGLVAFLAACVSITFGWLRVQAQPATFNLVGTSGANAAQTVTAAAAGAGVRNYLSGMTVSWTGGAPAAGTKVEVKDGATVIWTGYVGRVGAIQDNIDFEFSAPLQGTANTALNVVVDAAGAGVTTKVSAQGTTGP